ncbi:uncharacterized protein AB9W97_011033 [Spinachia spinachia]
MKRGKLHFLGRKNPSLFDSNIPIKEMENVELVLKSPAIPESGTASVRARPTVKHNASLVDNFQGFAVATPKVPLLPPVNGPKINGSFGGDNLSNGAVMSMPDLEEGELFVPPPPAMAPPPPPGAFIPPPLDFMGDLNSLNAATLPSLSMPDAKPASLPPFMEAEDLSFLKPPPMAPPEPPPSRSNGFVSTGPLSSPLPKVLTQRPAFSPPAPPSESQTLQKKPPPKPVRLSSMSILDSPPATSATPASERKTTLSTFNPQNTAKPFHVPQTSILSGYEEQNTRSKQMLLLEDSGSSNSAPVLVHVDAKAPKVATPYKPAPKDVQELKENLPITQPSESPPPQPNKEAKKGIVSLQPGFDKPIRTPHQTSPQLRKLNGTQLNSESIKDRFGGSPSQSLNFSPILDRKLRNLKGGETHVARDGPAASPLALLMAAKERDKHKWAPPGSQENSSEEDTMSSGGLALSRTVAAPSATNMVEQKLSAMQSPSISQQTQPEEIIMPLLPPPPEFDDFDDIMEPPPSMPPPEPPRKKAPTATELHRPPSHVPPPPPRPKIPEAPKRSPPEIDVKPKQQLVMKPKAAAAQLPSTVSTSQATLLSILQKKIMEMNPKMSTEKEAESSSYDWGAPLSDEDNKVPVVHRAAPHSKNYPVVNKAATLNMQELERKVAKKYEETSSGKVPNSNGTESKPQYGMTFNVRPGTHTPITLIRKGDP